MASIRRQILMALRDRLGEISGWDSQIVGSPHAASARVLADVYYASEEGDLANSDQYSATLNVHVLITALREDAAEDPDDEGNALLYVERLVGELQQVIHAPDAWGVNPDFTDVKITGHEVDPENDQTYLAAEVHLQFTFRHSFTDPGA